MIFGPNCEAILVCVREPDLAANQSDEDLWPGRARLWPQSATRRFVSCSLLRPCQDEVVAGQFRSEPSFGDVGVVGGQFDADEASSFA